jgi:hypothetical protein
MYWRVLDLTFKPLFPLLLTFLKGVTIGFLRLLYMPSAFCSPCAIAKALAARGREASVDCATALGTEHEARQRSVLRSASCLFLISF